ncbi:MAG: hypothetical protein M3Y27_06860, partial [Acidobacteriota bacterium]|nr:hypothetical protein [Acidobacteriota bacterium]
MAKASKTPRAKERKKTWGWKWGLLVLAALLLIPALQVAVVRFVNPPRTLPMLLEQGGQIFSSGPPLRYRWVDLG